jgi:hypothetical protein
MAKKIAEKKLWKIVKEGLEKKEYGYVCSNSEASRKNLREGFLTMGLDGIQADVIGFKDISKKGVGMALQPKLEIIAVEVKPDLPNYRQRHIDQAKRASLYAHKCFFAAPREFKPEEIQIATNSGIGLFQIDIENKRLKQIVPAKVMEPDEMNIVRLMDKLGYLKCTICNCYWNKEFVFSSYRPGHYFSKKFSIKFYNFICDSCARKIFKLLSPDLRKKFLEEWKIKRLVKNQIQDFKKKYAEEWKMRRLIRKQEAMEERLKRFYLIIDRRLRKKGNKLERQLKNIKRYLRERISQRHKKAIKEIRSIKRKLKAI